METKHLVSAITAITSLGALGCSATFTGNVKHNTSTDETIIEAGVEVTAESSQPSAFDADKFVIDTTGTTIPVPTSGWATVDVITETGATRLTKRVEWVRSGEMIFFADPLAVNYWIDSNMQSGESIHYETDPIGDGGASGTQVVEATTYYDGVQKSHAAATFQGSGGGGFGDWRDEQ